MNYLQVVSHSCERHQTPPDTVVERPVGRPWTLALEGKDETGEHEDHHHEHQDDETELLVTIKL